jgi:hypothetical protein
MRGLFLEELSRGLSMAGAEVSPTVSLRLLPHCTLGVASRLEPGEQV